MKYVKKALILLGFIACVSIISLSIGAFELEDTYFYYVLGRYIFTGYLNLVAPFNYTIPQTLYGPLYSVLLYFLTEKPWPGFMVILPFLQLCIITVNALILFSVLKRYVSRFWAKFTAILYLFLPFNIIYATIAMSEIVTTLFISLLFLCMHGIATKRQWAHPSLVVLFACLAVLTRNAMLPVFALSVAYWFFTFMRTIHHQRVPYGIFQHLPALAGLFLVFLWARFNFIYYRVWQLTSYTGRHLYNNVVTYGHILPPDTEPIMQEFMQNVWGRDYLFKPCWEVQLFFVNKWGDGSNGTLTETDIDKKFLQFVLAAIRHNPKKYLLNVLSLAYKTPITAPNHNKILATLGFQDPTCPDCNPITCRTPEIVRNTHAASQLCTPLVNLPIMKSIWASYIVLNRSVYPTGGAILALLAAVGIVASILGGPSFVRLTAVFFLLQHVMQSSSQWLEGRFLVALYPLYAVMITQGIRWCVIAKKRLSQGVFEMKNRENNH